MVNQIQKNAHDIEQRLEMIETTNLFKPCPLNQLGELPRCKVAGIHKADDVKKMSLEVVEVEHDVLSVRCV